MLFVLFSEPLFPRFSCFLTIPFEMLVSNCYRSSLPLRKDGILLEAKKNVPDMDRRPSLLTVDLNTPEGRECSRSATRLQGWVSEGLENAPPIWLR
ncbi:rCG22859 [Rattus norvegicus]|uniref:RCG22859 n=1 Tax=Rattus norvegicus TaxID=10116 RepID=A6KPD1_RAT|nr:rCG22859 [Rattus norvegicus]